MEENKFRYWKILLIDNDSNSKIYISEKNKYYIRNYNKSVHMKVLNKFRDIKKSYKINVNDTRLIIITRLIWIALKYIVQFN